MLFEREFMGLVCLGVVWINTVLICGHAGGQFLRLRRLRARMRPATPGRTGLVSGRFLAEGGDDGRGQSPLPTFTLVQTAKSRGDGKIYFHDQVSRADIPPGMLRVAPDSAAAPRVDGTVDGGETAALRVVPDGAEHLWVWPEAEKVHAQLRCPGVEAFDALAKPALQGKGVQRTVELPVSPSENVYLFGWLSEDRQVLLPADVPTDELSMYSAALPPAALSPAALSPAALSSAALSSAALPPPGTRTGSPALAGSLPLDRTVRRVLLLSTAHPGRVLARSMVLIAAVCTFVLLVGAGLTYLALWPPAFGTVSKWGAFGLLVFLLLVQPLGVWLTQRILLPHDAVFEGVWVRSKIAGDVASSRSDSQLSAG